MPYKDGVNKPRLTVHVDNWREAIELAQPGMTYDCGAGTVITFGSTLFRPLTVQSFRSAHKR